MDLGHFATAGGIELTKVQRPPDMLMGLGHFETAGGIEPTKIAERGGVPPTTRGVGQAGSGRRTSADPRRP
jgi:hypothetical protein